MNRLCLLIVLNLAATFCLADWPQYQGPNRDGVSPETVKLADSWPADGPKVVWKNEKLGQGYGGAIIQGGKVYILDRVDNKKDVLRCLNLETGKEEWQYAYDAVGADGKGVLGGYNGSRNHPVVDDKNVYILGPFGHVHAISKETHQPIWKIAKKDKDAQVEVPYVHMAEDYGAWVSQWGICQSPTLYKGALIVAPLTKKAGIVALDTQTGKEAWKSENVGEMAWASPSVVTLEGVDQIVIMNSRGQPRLVGVEPGTGKKLWQYSKWQLPNPIGSHSYCGQGRFFLSGGYGAGCVMVQVKKEGDAWKAEEVFQNKDCGAQAVMPVFYKDAIYANSNDVAKDTKKGNGLMCMDLEGKVKWAAGNDNIEELGGVLIADGKIYRYFSEKGEVAMAKADPAEYKELGRAKVFEGKIVNSWAPVAYSGGKLFVRHRNTMVCLDLTTGQ